MPQDGWGSPLGGMPSAFGLGGNAGMGMGMNPAMLTPQQRAQMYAMSLMRGGSMQPQSSGWGAINNGFAPIMGAIMGNQFGGQGGMPAPYWGNPTAPSGNSSGWS